MNAGAPCTSKYFRRAVLQSAWAEQPSVQDFMERSTGRADCLRAPRDLCSANPSRKLLDNDDHVIPIPRRTFTCGLYKMSCYPSQEFPTA